MTEYTITLTKEQEELALDFAEKDTGDTTVAGWLQNKITNDLNRHGAVRKKEARALVFASDIDLEEAIAERNRAITKRDEEQTEKAIQVEIPQVEIPKVKPPKEEP